MSGNIEMPKEEMLEVWQETPEEKKSKTTPPGSPGAFWNKMSYEEGRQ